MWSTNEPAFDPVEFDPHQAVDTDGDGIADTMTVHHGDDLIVAYDLDHDGHTDYETVFDGHGGYQSWEFQESPHGPQWDVVAHGDLG